MGDNQTNNEQMLINDQYLIVKKIAQGGFGIIWKAYDFSLKNFIALKELLKDYTEPKFIEMFYKEALIAKNIIHDNVVRVQHFWRGSNGLYYLAMDHVPGRDLEYLLDKCNKKNSKLPWELKFPWELAVLICSSVLKALDYANRQAKDPITGKPYGIVYRDISPGNIMISFDGNVKLGDFGIAKTAEELSIGGGQRVVAGKYGYMSPEQMRGDTDIDQRSDIFSVGLVLYEMLTGQKLFSGDPKKIKNQVLETKFDSSMFNSVNISQDLIEIVSRSLEKDRENRYEKAIEMFRDLRRLLKGKETEEFAQELSNLVNGILTEEVAEENELFEKVKALNLQDIKSNQSIKKIICKDFIMGEENEVNPPEILSAKEEFDAACLSGDTKENLIKPLERAKTPVNVQTFVAAAPRAEQREEGKPKGEEKGKTVFEEVGDWLGNKFKTYKIRIVRAAAAIVVSGILFLIIDTYARITPVGRSIYYMLYPPDAVISTIPSGAIVSVRDREGKVIISEANSDFPIELRKIAPKTYIITASKAGFNPVERIVKVENRKQNGSSSVQHIDIYFDFPVAVDSEPKGAEVFIDGNKFKTAPWKGELTAGEHTIRLSLEGFEELGSLAKESKEGQCNIDFTRTTQEEMFSGVDKNFWKYEEVNNGEEKVYNVTGYLFKKFSVNSIPKNVLVHVHSEGKPRGRTPITMALKAGEYRLRFMDPEGRYEETSRIVRVDKGVDSKILVILNKWITIKVNAKSQPDKIFSTNVKITGRGLNVAKEISNAKPLRIALHPDNYTLIFSGNKEFKSLTLKDVNIDEQTNIDAELEPASLKVNVMVKEFGTEKTINGAYVWMQDKIVGKTNVRGVWESEVDPGTATVRIVAKGYVEKSVPVEFQMGESNDITIELDPEILAAAISTNTLTGIRGRNTTKKTEFNIVRPVNAEDNDKPQKNILICPNCKKQYIVGSKKPRFCTNCGKPFR